MQLEDFAESQDLPKKLATEAGDKQELSIEIEK
jgi:hypothetical protein